MARLSGNHLHNRAWFEREPYGGFWERGYRDLSVSTMGGPSQEVVEILPALPANGRVLDLGCGEGRNSFFLAAKGLRVTAIDRSTAGITKLLALSKGAGINLTGIVADIATIDIVDRYDLIMAHGVLYYLSNPEWRRLLAQAKEQTNPGGFHEHTIFIFNDENPCPPEYRSARYMHSFSPYELKEFYADWEIIRYDVYVKWDQHPGIPLHCHPIEKIVVRKPGGKGSQPIVEPVPIGPDPLPMDTFHSIAMGLEQDKLLSVCGEPNVIDRVTANGVQVGITTSTVEGYDLHLWYYGPTVIYVINGQVWGRAHYSTQPVRVRFEG